MKMRQRGRPRRSSMPAVAHKMLDHPYSRQQQSPPTEHYYDGGPEQHHYYYNSGGPDSGEEDQDPQQQQLSDRYSRIQLADHWPFNGAGQRQRQQQQQQMVKRESGGGPTADTSPDLDQQLGSSGEFPPMEYYQQQTTDEEDQEHDLQGPSFGQKRKRAFSFSSAPSASTTATLTMTSSNGGAQQQQNSDGPLEKRPATKICRVCGDKAYSYNFNVITCESCKAFFRRNANKEKEIRCPFNEQCDINIVSRRFCQRCRLQKCFRVGMKKEWIMSDEARMEKKQRIQENRERRAAAAAAVAVLNPQQGGDPLEPPGILQEQGIVVQQDALVRGADVPMQLQLQQQATGTLGAAESSATVEQHHLTSTLLSSAQTAAAGHLHQQAVEGISLAANPLGAIASSNPFVTAPPAVVGASPVSVSLLGGGPNPEQQQQVMAAAQVAAVAQACAVQQAVNQAAVALLQHHHHSQQQQHMDTGSLQQSMEGQQPPGAGDDSSSLDPPPVVGIPAASSTSIHTTMAGGEQQMPSAAPSSFMGHSPADQLLQQSHNHQRNTESPPSAIGSLSMITTGSDTSTGLTPAAAVAAALIHQQQNNAVLAPQVVPVQPTAVTNGQQVLANSSAAAIQQQLASQVVSHQQNQQQLAEQQSHCQQQAMAAVAVAQLQAQAQQQAQAQHQAAQIVAHAQHMVHQQQQQLAALANAAAVHHQQNQQQSAATTTAAAMLSHSAGGGGQPSMDNGGSPAEAVGHHHLQHMAGSLSSCSLSANGSPSQGAANAPTGVLPSFIEVAAHLAAQPTVASASSAPTIPQPTAANPPAGPAPGTVLLPPGLMSTSAQAAAANMLMQQHHHQHQQQPMGQPGTNPSSLPPPPPPLGTVTSALPSLTAAQQPSLVVPVQQLGHPLAAQQQQPEMVSVPKDMLIKLVEQKMEAEREQQQMQSKCQCHCQCGRYPAEVLIVDKVMTDLLESSSKQLGSEQQSSNNSTPRLSQQFQPAHFHHHMGVPNCTSQQQMAPLVGGVPLEAMDITNSGGMSSAQQLHASDQEQLAELSRANEVWKSAGPSMVGNPNGDLQFLLGHYTDSDLRRMIAVAKTLEAFKRLDQQDQERLLKGCFEGFFVLRSLLSLDPSEFSFSLMRQNGVPETTIRFYAEFPAEWRKNEMVNLLLGMLLLFNVEVAGLQSAISVTVENMKFQSLLKRLLFILCDRDSARTEAANAELMARVDLLKQLFPATGNGSRVPGIGVSCMASLASLANNPLSLLGQHLLSSSMTQVETTSAAANGLGGS